MKRTSPRRLLNIVASLALIGGLAGCGATSGGGATPTSSTPASPTNPTPDSPSPSASASAEQTVLTMNVQGCDACTISAIQVGPKDNYFQTPFVAAGRVTGTQVTLAVPTKYTKGMYFTATCQTGQCNSSNAQPVVVLRYPNQPVGAMVGDAVAASQKTASMCWAGTTGSTASFSLTTTTFADKDLSGNPMTSMRIWASPQIDVVPGTDATTFHGGLGAQDFLHC